MSYIYESENKIPWNHTFTARNRNNAWMIITGRNQPTTFQQVLEAISSQQLTGKYNKVHGITARRDKETIRTNIQENRCIFNEIRNIQAIGTNIIILPIKHPAPDHIVDMVKIPLRSECYDSIFQTMIKWRHPQQPVHLFTLLNTIRHKYTQTQNIF